MYGNPENCSVERFLTILLNVGTGDTNSPKAKMFPKEKERKIVGLVRTALQGKGIGEEELDQEKIR